MSNSIDDIPEKDLLDCAENTMNTWSHRSMADAWKWLKSQNLEDHWLKMSKEEQTRWFLDSLILGKINRYKAKKEDFVVYTNTCLKTNKLLMLAVCQIKDMTATNYDFMSVFDRKNKLNRYLYEPEFCQVEYNLHVPKYYNKVEAIILERSPFHAYFRGKKNMRLLSKTKIDGTKYLHVYETVNPNVQYQLPSNHAYSV